MRNILITQVINYSQKKGFSYSLSKQWYDYSKKIGFNLIPYNFIFNHNIIKKLKLSGLILSGGNDLSSLKFNKANNFRDKKEKEILNYCIKKKIPVLGVCRGFQFIAFLNNSNLKKCKKHVRTKHKITLKKSKFTKDKILEVNSYHNYCIQNLSTKFNVVAKNQDKTIEIAEHNNNKIIGIMFHPERQNISQRKIDNLVKNFFKIK